MLEKVEIPSPAELGKRIKADEDKDRDKLEQFSHNLLRNSGIAEFLMENRYTLYRKKGKVKKEIKVDPSDLKKENIDIKNVTDHIKKLLDNYTVIAEPDEKQNIIDLTISIPINFFAEEEDEECK